MFQASSYNQWDLKERKTIPRWEQENCNPQLPKSLQLITDNRGNHLQNTIGNKGQSTTNEIEFPEIAPVCAE
jgi:hypothetical protein